MNAEAAVDAGALEADEDAEFWGSLDFFLAKGGRYKARENEGKLDVAQGT